MYRAILLASFLFCLSFHSTAAQQPTTTQRDAIRSSCRSDFIAKCSGVEPGGKAALECLEGNRDSLSPSCKAAIDAVAGAPPAAPASAETPPAAEAVTPTAATPAAPSANQTPTAASQDERLEAVRRACTLDDVAAHCSWIAPTSPEIVLCLQANAKDLSSACKSAVTGASAPKAAITPPAEPAQSVEPAKKSQAHGKATTAATPAAPSAAQTAAIHSACRSDFTAHCSAGRQRCPAMPRYQFSEAVARLPHCGCCGWRYRRRRCWDQHRTVSSNAGSRCPARCAAHAAAIHNAGTAFIHFADLPHGRGNIVRGYTTWRWPLY